MQLGVVGKPNVGKSTFFRCVTDSAADVAGYPFTTVDPNHGVGYLVVDCPCQRLDVDCNPSTRCRDGKRFVPVELLDIAGLVPGAADGKGMGNAFLDDVRQADALIHVIDAAGETDAAGEPVEDYDPVNDVRFVADELDAWLHDLLWEQWDALVGAMRSSDQPPDAVLADRLSGLGVDRRAASQALDADTDQLQHWDTDAVAALAEQLRAAAFPMVHAANKVDLPPAASTLDRLRDAFPGHVFVPMSAQAELQLQQAADQGKIAYVPGSDSFTVTGDLSPEQEDGLQQIRELLDQYGGTGVQAAMAAAVRDRLGMIVVYPVDDPGSYEDQHGNVLPDAVLLEQGSTPVDLAAAIHSDIADRYAQATDAETGRAIGKDAALEDGQIVSIETQ